MADDSPSIPTYSPTLTAAERQSLAQYSHTFDYTLSEEQIAFLDEHGYLVLREIIDEATIDALVREALSEIEKTTNVKIKESSTWPSVPFHGCFNIWHTKTFNRLRQNPLLYSIFAQLLKTHNLTVSVDRICLKAPCLSEAKSAELAEGNRFLELHTDLNYWHSDPNQPIYQGGLCLQDCQAGGGGFFCIPGFHKPYRVQAYMALVDKGRFGIASSLIPKKGKAFVTYFDQHDANLNKLEIPMNKGDFVIWNNNLPHAGGKNALMAPSNPAPNSLQNWRMHAFIMFVPLDGPCVSEETAAFYTAYQQETRHAISCGQPPLHFATRNRAPTGKEEAKKSKASSGAITPLGERILGLVDYSVPESES